MTEEIEIQAAEYVFVTLAAEERTQFESLLATNDAARGAVVAWQQRLVPLAASIEEVAPPAAVWQAIDRSISGLPGSAAATQEDTASNVPVLAGLLKSRQRWRVGALVSTGIAAGLALFSLNAILRERPEATGSYLAVVNRGGNLPALIIRVDLASRSVFVRPVATTVPEGHSLELWYIGQGKAPKSMGLVNRDTMKVRLPGNARIEKASFAVTVEPKGGSSTGGPTGPIVYSGELLKE